MDIGFVDRACRRGVSQCAGRCRNVTWKPGGCLIGQHLPKATKRLLAALRSAGYPLSLAMRAHRVRVRVAKNQELRLTLPSDFPAGEAEVIVLEAPRADETKKARKLTVDELLAAKLPRPPGIGPVTLGDMEQAIVEGARGRGGI